MLLMRDSRDTDIWKVTQAKAAAHVKIVTYDWLEDSLLARRRKAEKDYLLSRIIKKVAKQKAITAAARRKELEEGGWSIRSRQREHFSLTRRTVKKYHQDCKDFARDMLTGKTTVTSWLGC